MTGDGTRASGDRGAAEGGVILDSSAPRIDELTFDAAGLIPVIAQQAGSGEVLMLAYMDAEAVRRTLESGAMTYFSRSRQEYWVKGATSGNRQQLVELRYDCDADALLATVDQTGPACHTGTRSCFTGRVLRTAQ